MKVWKEGRIKKKFDWRGKGAFLNRSSNAFSFHKKMWIEAEVPWTDKNKSQPSGMCFMKEFRGISLCARLKLTTQSIDLFAFILIGGLFVDLLFRVVSYFSGGK